MHSLREARERSRGVGIVAWVTLLCVLSVPTLAIAQDAEGSARCALGAKDDALFRQLFGEGKLAQIEDQHKRAIALFKRAYLLCADAELLWWLGQSYEAGDEPERARSYYSAYLRELPPSQTQRHQQVAARLVGLNKNAQGAKTSTTVPPLRLDPGSRRPIPSINLGQSGPLSYSAPERPSRAAATRERIDLLDEKAIGDKHVPALRLDDVAIADESPSPDRSSLVIDTNPAGAKVFVDVEQGQPVATTPTPVLSMVPERRYRIIIIMPGYVRLEREIKMERDSNKKLYFTLERERLKSTLP